MQVIKDNLWKTSVEFPQESWGKGLTFHLSDKLSLEGGISMPVKKGVFPLKGLKSNTMYYYRLDCDSLSLNSVIHSFITPYYSPVSPYLELSENGNRILCKIEEDIPADSIIEKGFYSEQERDWKVVVNGSDFSISADSAMYSMRGYVIQRGGLSSSIQNFKVEPRFDSITEMYRNNELLLQCKITCCRFGGFQRLRPDGEWVNVDANYVKTLYNGCIITLIAPEHSATIRPTALGYYGREYQLNRNKK